MVDGTAVTALNGIAFFYTDIKLFVAAIENMTINKLEIWTNI